MPLNPAPAGGSRLERSCAMVKPKMVVSDDDEDRSLLLRVAARGGNRRAMDRGHLSLHGVPTAYRLGLQRQRPFPEGAGEHRGTEQSLPARQRLGTKSRISFLPRLRHLSILVCGDPP